MLLRNYYFSQGRLLDSTQDQEAVGGRERRVAGGERTTTRNTVALVQVKLAEDALLPGNRADVVGGGIGPFDCRSQSLRLIHGGEQLELSNQFHTTSVAHLQGLKNISEGGPACGRGAVPPRSEEAGSPRRDVQ